MSDQIQFPRRLGTTVPERDERRTSGRDGTQQTITAPEGREERQGYLQPFGYGARQDLADFNGLTPLASYVTADQARPGAAPERLRGRSGEELSEIVLPATFGGSFAATEEADGDLFAQSTTRGRSSQSGTRTLEVPPTANSAFTEVSTGVYFEDIAGEAGRTAFRPENQEVGSLGSVNLQYSDGTYGGATKIEVGPIEQHEYLKNLVEPNTLVQKGQPILEIIDPELEEQLKTAEEDITLLGDAVTSRLLDAETGIELLEARKQGGEAVVETITDAVAEQQAVVLEAQTRADRAETARARKLETQYGDIATQVRALWVLGRIESIPEYLRLEGFTEQEIALILARGAYDHPDLATTDVNSRFLMPEVTGAELGQSRGETFYPPEILAERPGPNSSDEQKLRYRRLKEDYMRSTGTAGAHVELLNSFTDAVLAYREFQGEDTRTVEVVEATKELILLKGDLARARTDVRLADAELDRNQELIALLEKSDGMNFPSGQSLTQYILSEATVEQLPTEIVDAVRQYRLAVKAKDELMAVKDQKTITAVETGWLTRTPLTGLRPHPFNNIGALDLGDRSAPQTVKPGPGLDFNNQTPILIPVAVDGVENVLDVTVDQTTADQFREIKGSRVAIRTASGDWGVADVEDVFQIAGTQGFRVVLTGAGVFRPDGTVDTLELVNELDPVEVFLSERPERRDFQLPSHITLGEALPQEITDQGFKGVMQEFEVRIPIYKNAADTRPIGHYVVKGMGWSDGRYARFTDDSVVASIEVNGNTAVETPAGLKQALTNIGAVIGTQTLPDSGAVIPLSMTVTPNNDTQTGGVSLSAGGGAGVPFVANGQVSARLDKGVFTIPDSRSRSFRIEIAPAGEGQTDANGTKAAFVLNAPSAIVLND